MRGVEKTVQFGKYGALSVAQSAIHRSIKNLPSTFTQLPEMIELENSRSTDSRTHYNRALTQFDDWNE